jgi:hypothetical protein
VTPVSTPLAEEHATGGFLRRLVRTRPDDGDREPDADRLSDELDDPERDARSRRAWWRLPGVAFPIALFAVWRLVQLAITAVASGRFYEPTFQYDGERYLRIMRTGFGLHDVEMPDTAFFPLVAWLARPIYWVTGSPGIAGTTIATLTALGAFVAVWGISREWVGERLARHALVLMAVFPASLFLTSFYSEGLFVALGAGGVWADKRNRPWLAAVCFAGVSMTRSVGILVPAVVVLARIIRTRGLDRRALGYAAAAAAGLGAVMVDFWVETGDPLAFLKVQDDWQRGLSMPWTTVLQGWENLWPVADTVLVPTLIARNLDLWCVLIVAVGIGYAAWMAHRRVLPMEVWMLGVVLIVLPLCSANLASFNRFVFAMWVLYPVFALLASRLPRWPRLAFWLVSLGALGYTSWVMASEFADGKYVA